MREEGAGRPAAGGAGGRNWLRMLYLTNLSLIVAAVVVYLGGVPFPVAEGSPWQRPLSLFIWLVALAILWFLLDGLGLVQHYEFLAALASGRGLRWLDVACGVFGLAGLLFALRCRPPDEATAIVAVLTLVHSALGLAQLQQPYSDETLQRFRQAQEGTAPHEPAVEDSDRDGQTSGGDE